MTLLDKIDKWMTERRESRGGFAEITDQDMIDLNEII